MILMMYSFMLVIRTLILPVVGFTWYFRGIYAFHIAVYIGLYKLTRAKFEISREK